MHKEEVSEGETLYCSIKQEHLIDDIIDRKLIVDAKPALDKQQVVNLEYDICNTDRTTGAMLSNEISKKYKDLGLPEDTINVKFKGSAGQSFGCFAAKGIRFDLKAMLTIILAKVCPVASWWFIQIKLQRSRRVKIF